MAATCRSSNAGHLDEADLRRNVAELVALAPDVILTTGGISMGPLLQATRMVPIVFVQVTDPVGAGYVESLARPGGNATGFIPFEFGMSAKWLELLKEIAPGIKRVGGASRRGSRPGPDSWALSNPWRRRSGWSCARSASRSRRDRARHHRLRARPERRADLDRGARGRFRHREMIIGLAARHKLPAVYPYRFFAADGGLIAYGPDTIEPYRRAAGYVDRILKGEKPADLPVQAPTKYELVINLKTAKALGLTVPTRCSPAPTR